ncbi:hypothetical protein Godav_010780, partial [Gossypium davidsonii]|nr:hypothetical protein [Gossypium davidsonii]
MHPWSRPRRHRSNGECRAASSFFPLSSSNSKFS